MVKILGSFGRKLLVRIHLLYTTVLGRNLALIKHYTNSAESILTTMCSFSEERKHQQKKRDELSSVLYA